MTGTEAASPLRSIRQPGPPPAERVVAVEGRGLEFPIRLNAGVRLLDGIAQAFAARGFTGGVVEVAELALDPMAYVMPALSATLQHAAYYSETFRPAGGVRLQHGALTFGRRDGAAFFHAHALWREVDGKRCGGHILPDDTVVAEAAEVTGFGFAGGGFRAVLDPETNFKLFEPAAGPAGLQGHVGARAFALRLRPNQDLAGALEGFCAACGIDRARIRGGVGSTIGARFTDGAVVEHFATEVYLRGGLIEPAPGGALRAHLPAGLVDYTGAIAEGVLSRGENPVLMTFEVILEEFQ